MNRLDWLKSKRRATEERYDHLWVPIYDDNWGNCIGTLHRQLLAQIVSTLPAHATILDAACGTGKYWPILLTSGRQIMGIDQSGKMLECAIANLPRSVIHQK